MDGEKGEKAGWICSFRCNLKCGRRCYERPGIVHESPESPDSSGLLSKATREVLSRGGASARPSVKDVFVGNNGRGSLLVQL